MIVVCKCGNQMECGHDEILRTFHIDRFTANLLIVAAKKAQRREVPMLVDPDNRRRGFTRETFPNVILQKDFNTMGQEYARLAELKHWKFMMQRPDWWKRGIYQLTSTATDFITGRTRMPREITVIRKTGERISSSEEVISFRDAIAQDWPTVEDYIARWTKAPLYDDEDQMTFEWAR